MAKNSRKPIGYASRKFVNQDNGNIIYIQVIGKKVTIATMDHLDDARISNLAWLDFEFVKRAIREVKRIAKQPINEKLNCGN